MLAEYFWWPMTELEIRHQIPHNAYEWKQEGLQRQQREDVCVSRGINLGETALEEGGGVCAGLRGPQSLAYVRNAAKVEAAPVCMLAPACPRVFPLHPSAVLSAGATGVNAGRISLSAGRGHWMAAFHGQQKHWLRVRADLKLLRKRGLELWLDLESY